MVARRFASPVFVSAVRRATAVSLRVKIAGLVASMVLVLGLVTWLVVHANVRSILSQRLDAHALSVAQGIAAHYTDAVTDGSPADTNRLIATTMAHDSELLYVIVRGADGRLLSRVARPEAPAELLAGGRPLGGGEPQVVAVETSIGQVREATAPVGAGNGHVTVGLSESELRAAIADTDRNLMGVTATVLAVTVAVSLALTGLLTRPILSLQRAVRATSLDNLPGRARPQMDDEIGELTRAFNWMTHKLARSRDELMAQNRELAVLNATAQAISGSHELNQILRAALGEILEQMHLQAGWIFLTAGHGEAHRSWEDLPPAESSSPPPAFASLAFGNRSDESDGEATRPASQRRQLLYMAVQVGLGEAFAREEADLDFEGCLCLDVLDSGDCGAIQCIAAECPRLRPETIRAEGLVSHVMIPLVARDRVVGVLNVAADSDRTFSADEMRLLCSIGRQVGVAVENARLWDQVRRKEQLRGQLLERIMSVQEEERRRIALELHDQTGSSLASLGVGLRMLEDSAPLPRAARERLYELKEQVNQIAGDLHRLAFELRPLALDRLGLADTVEQSVQLFARQHGLAADFQAIGLDGEGLPVEVETALYRIVQEALTNIAKHAEATELGVVLERRADSVVAVIEDNGRGFDVAEAMAGDERQLGLFGMQERAALAGGRWQVESSPGHGTTVFVEVPLREPVASSQ